MASAGATPSLRQLLGEMADEVARDGRAALLWAEDGSGPLAMSEGVAAVFRLAPGELIAFPVATPARARIRAFARAASEGEPRSESLRFIFGSRFETIAAENRLVRLQDGGTAVLSLLGAAPVQKTTESLKQKTEAGAGQPAPAPESKAIEPATDALPTPAAPEKTPAVRTEETQASGKTVVPLPAVPQRFVFRTDPDGRITNISGSALTPLGIDPAKAAGRPLAELVGTAHATETEKLRTAFAERRTWHGLIVQWPTSDGLRLVPVGISATADFAADRNLGGFTGFGLCRFDQATDVVKTVAAIPAERTDIEADSDDGDISADDDLESTLAKVFPATKTGDDDTGEAPADPDVSVGPDLASDVADPLEVDDDVPSITLPEPDSPVSMPGKAAQDNAPAEGKVLHLPTVVPATPARVVPLKVSGLAPASLQPQSLSNAERNAFREIARALGARFEEADAPALPAALPIPAPPPAPIAAPPAVAKMDSAPVISPPATGGPATEVSLPSGEQGVASAILERIPVGILIFRGETPLYLNRPLLDLTGYASVDEFMEMRGLDRLFGGRTAAALTAGAYDTVSIMGNEGQTLPVDAHFQMIDWAGRPATLVTFRRAHDAEQGPRLRTLELELAARRADIAEARAMLDTATDGVVSLDDNGRILALNRSAEALFGYDQKELAGERFTLLLAAESHALAFDYLDGLKSGGVASVLNDGREVIGKERNGGRIPLFMTVGRVSETGKFAAVLRDLTAWKRAESELTDAKRAAERASALKSDFLAKISHEIRTPMNAIIGFAEVMRDERLGPIGTERYKEYLKDIHTSGEHVISLVNDLLDLSKIEAGRMDLTFGSVDLNAIVTSCLGIMQPQANRDRVIMRSQLATKLPPVVADERSIRQIVLNLLSNASKFTEPGGQVIISTALTEAGEVVMRVRDTGIGMTESEITAALEPFRQLSTTRHRGGTGLGLPLTKALVEANRASFVIRSKSREGTLVEVTFPPTRVLAE